MTSGLDFYWYIWSHGNTWPLSYWHIFIIAVRKNNDIEGWHHASNRSAAGRWLMSLYLLIELLHREAKLSYLQIWLMSEKKLKRIQRLNYRSLQSQIFYHQENNLENRTSPQQLLRACRYLYGPVHGK